MSSALILIKYIMNNNKSQIKFAPTTFMTVPNKDFLEDMNIYAKCVYITLCFYANKNWVAEIAIQDLAEKNKCWRDSIMKWIKELESLKIIKKYKRWKSKTECFVNLYQVQILDYIDDTEWEVVSEVDVNDVVGENDSNNTTDIYNNISHINNNIHDYNTTGNMLPIRAKKKKKSDVLEVLIIPTREEIYSFMWEKRWTKKLCDILEEANIKQSFTLQQLKNIYDWMIDFFLEKYPDRFKKDRDWNFTWTEVVMNELDKFIAYYWEKKDNEIYNLKARLRKWITRSTEPYSPN